MKQQVVIENPVINSPFEEPERHFRFDDEGITQDIVPGRRESGYFIPIPTPRGRRTNQADMIESSHTQDRWQRCELINRIRPRVALWRKSGYPGVTRVTKRLLEHWSDPERDKKFFFCQIEALETAIYIAEVARQGDQWIENRLREEMKSANPELFRMAFKMATGSGKTVVMAMIIAWQTLNKIAHPQDARFSDAFLIVTPGITIKDRLRVLMPNDPQSYYRQRDIVPPGMASDLERAKIVITNYHAFQLREKVSASKLAKQVAAGREGQIDAFKETPGEMVRRVCRDLGNKRGVIALNDEAHHCYRRKPDGEGPKLKGEERREAEKQNKAAFQWITGLEAVKAKLGVKVVYDLSATPFFLRGSGQPENSLFPWVVSDFSLIDAIESGIVKVPRVPVADDADPGGVPTYRDLWLRIREDLPRKGRKTEKTSGPPEPPKELEGALSTLYTHYEKLFHRWEANEDARQRGAVPPVFIVVCNNTNVSKLVFDWISGWEPEPRGESRVKAGNLALFRNERDGAWLPRPNTILIDSEELETGDSMSPEFKRIAALEIEEFKHELRLRFPGRAHDEITDEALLREVMNTVGKPGKLGEHVRCVVSVSMLTEGWDANTVTHILGVRAFGTQLLCEQVVGRGLRRMSYDAKPRSVTVDGETHEFLAFPPEYAEVYGVPFSFIPCSGKPKDDEPGPTLTRVFAVPERAARCQITFPRVLGYRWDFEGDRLEARFNGGSRLALSTQDIPSWTDVHGIVGEQERHRPDDLRQRREQEIVFRLAKLTLEKYFRLDPASRGPEDGAPPLVDGEVKAWLFPQVAAIARRWLTQCVELKDGAFPGMLLLAELAHTAADKIHQGIVQATDRERRLLPILPPYDARGSTQHVDFDTSKPVWRTSEEKCHVNYVVADTQSWEQKVAQSLEEMPQVRCYVKNHGLGFTIPYTHGGQERQYTPDFIARVDDGGPDPLNLLLECTGETRRDKEAKVATAMNLWVPAVNNHGGFGRWDFVEVRDPWGLSAAIAALDTDHPSDRISAEENL